MDLVDIDQVLDNLELREEADERNKAPAVGKRHNQHQHHHHHHHHSSNNGDIHGGSAAAGTSKLHHQNSSSTVKSFVGVSQVLNSLDDYRKNVESLGTASRPEYDEECRPIAGIGGSSRSRLIAAEADRQPRVAEETSSRENEVRYHAVDDDGEEDASDDIHKFTEQQSSRQFNGGDDNNAEDEDASVAVTISDSLTTSSSSTFSSGPSPGFASTTDEHSAPLTPVEDEEKDIEVADDGEEDCSALLAERGSQQLPAADSMGDSESELISRSHSHGGAVEELACGLSSICLTTGDSQLNFAAEGSVSSALGNVLDDLSETTTTSLLSQMRENVENERVEEKADEVKDEMDHNNLENNRRKEERAEESRPAQSNEPKSEDGHKPNVEQEKPEQEQDKQEQLEQSEQQQQQPRKHRPITFCSTMDEISDTELDSMLQDMDIDDDGGGGGAGSGEKPSARYVGESANGGASQFDQAVVVSEEEDPRDDVAAAQILDEVDCNAMANQANDDSFSQASTVEFSEIRAQSIGNVMAQGDDMGQGSNSLASSYTSTESSLDAPEARGGVAELDDDAENGDELSHSRPQRPTSLDLPEIKPCLYANAGQTPPGAGMAQNADMTGHVNDGDVTTAPLNDVATSGQMDEASGYSDPHANLGKIPPIWVPDNMAAACMQCHVKFTMIKRRHHCRACGKVLCSVCCSQKYKLEFVSEPESRVCVQCYLILSQRSTQGSDSDGDGGLGVPECCTQDATSIENGESEDPQALASPIRSPNPNNPMEYCSTIPPHRQVSSVNTPPPAVIVPVGVLKKDGSYSSNSSHSGSAKTRKRKSVMFSDGIAPGSDLANMEHQWSEAKHARRGHHHQAHGAGQRGSGGSHKAGTPPVRTESSSEQTSSAMGLMASLFRGALPPVAAAAAMNLVQGRAEESGFGSKESPSRGSGDKSANASASTAAKTTLQRLPPSGADERGCFIPKDERSLPPLYVSKDESGCDFDYKDVANNYELFERLQRETLKFAIQKNFYVYVKIAQLKCCMNRTVINFTTSGMHHVGNDEIIILLECDLPASKQLMTDLPLPRDIFVHLYEVYRLAEIGNPIAELSFTSPQSSSFLGSRDYGGFIYIRATFQCLQDLIVPENPFLIGILIHRYEVPWAKVFPLRLMLRLGAQYRYYPCPHISIRNRESVYGEIAQTIINFLADFRNYSYTLPSIRGLFIHMEDRQTTVTIPRNRHDDIIKAINNSSDHILAFGGNFSKTADGHLVCMQNTTDDKTEMYSYSTQAINIQGQPRKVTGASFFVLNEALKSTSGLSGKCSIVEDGLMVQILPAKMEEVRNSLRNQKDIDIVCGPLDGNEQQTEVVSIKWVENDRDFNIGVISPIDNNSMEGVSSMRVHASFNYANTNYSIRLTDIYIIKFDDWYSSTHAAITASSADITRIAEQIARSASMALVPFLDLLAASGSTKLGLRATLHQENVCYEAGSRGSKLPPLYMNALDNHLIPTLHNESTGIEEAIVLELIFYILNV